MKCAKARGIVATGVLLFSTLLLMGCDPPPIRYEMTAYLSDNGRHFQRSVVQEVGWHGEPLPSDNNPTGGGASFLVFAQALPIEIRGRTLVISDGGWSWPSNTKMHACTGPFTNETLYIRCELQEGWSAYRALSRHANLSVYNSRNDYSTFASVGYAFTGDVELEPEEVPAVFTFAGNPGFSTIKIIDSKNLEAEFGSGVKLERVVVRPTTKPLSRGMAKMFPFIRLNAHESPPTTQDIQQASIFPVRLFYSDEAAAQEDR